MACKWLNREVFASHEDFRKNCRVARPDHFNFAFDVVDAIAEEDPNRRAMVWCNDEGEERIFTMADISRESKRAANAFLRLGIRRGDPVMLILKRRYEFWFATVALNRIGAVVIPATNQLLKKDIVYRVEAASVKAIVCTNEPFLRNAIDEAATETNIPLKLVCKGSTENGWQDFDALMAAESDVVDEQFCARNTTAADMMMLYFTSGTTGFPKMVRHNFFYPLGHVVTAKFWQCVVEGGLHLTVAETGWAKAAWGKIYGQWMCGTAIMVYDMDRFNAKNLLNVIKKYKVTTFCAPPTIFRYFIKEDLKDGDYFKSVTHCNIAGEALNPEVFQQFYEITGLKLCEGFGQTESTVIVGTFPWMEPKPGSMGKASVDYDVDLLDADGRSCEVGEEGQLVIRTDRIRPLGLFDEYYRAEEVTRQQWRNGVYYTGDLCWRDEDGYFWYVGRADDVIKSSGYRIGPFEVESALMEHPAVLECAVTGAPDPVRGQVVKATIVLAKGYQPSDELVKEIQNHVKHTTAPYKYPRIVQFVDELPKTISGKIRRVAIRQQDNQQQAHHHQ